MSNLEQYIANTKEYINQHPDLTENEIIMYIYLDLGQRLKFDQDFFFGGNKKKRRIYDFADDFEELEDCLENNKIICKSASYMLEYILSKLGIKIRTVEDPNDYRKYKHVYNIITPKDGTEEYIIDLQEDIINIHFHDFTSNFGISTKQPGRYVVSREEQKEMHKKFDYISKENPYTDEYIYLLKEDMDLYDDFYERLDFVLKNIDPMEDGKADYWERKWKHDRLLAKLFSQGELTRKVHTIEFYKRTDNSKKYINGYFINASNNKVTAYMYSPKKRRICEL